MLKKVKVKHPNKVGRVGRKKKNPEDKAIQIPGPYFYPSQIKALGGKDQVTGLIHSYARELRESVETESK